MAPRHRRHLRNYLLDRQFQLRFTVVIVLIAAVLTAGLGYFWYDEMRTTSRIVEVKALATMSDADVAKVKGDLHNKDMIRLGILGVFGVAIAVVLGVFSIVFTHRVAGPLFKISRHHEDITQDNLKEIWDLRKGDQLQAFWTIFKEMHTALRERQKADIEVLDRAMVALAGLRSGPGGVLGEVTELRDHKKASLDGTLDVGDDAEGIGTAKAAKA